MINNPPSNISRRINNLSADETTFNKSNDLYNNPWPKEDLNKR